MADFFNDSIQGVKDLLNEIKTLKSELLDLAKINRQAAQGVNPAEAKAEDIEKLNKATKNLIATEQQINKLDEQEKTLTIELNKSKKQQVKVTKELSDADKEQIKLRKKLTDLTKDNAKQTAVLRQAIQNENRALRNNAKRRTEAAGSLNQLRAQLNEARRRFDALSKAERENIKVGGRYTKLINNLDKEVRKLEKSTGRTQRNVGNYTEGIKNAASESGLFSRQLMILNQIQGTLNALMSIGTTETEVNTVAKQTNKAATQGMTRAQKALTVATNFGSKALKGFKIALASTGVGAIVVALGGLISFLTGTQRGMDKVSNATAGLGAAFSVIRDRLSGVGEALSLFFSGDFSEGFEMLKKSFEGIGDEIARETKEATELEKQLQKLRDLEIELIGTRAKLRKEVELNRLVAKDEDLSNRQRLAALDKAIEKENELLDVQLEAAVERARIARAQLNLAESTAEEIQEVAELEAAVIDLETANLKRRRTIESERVTFIRKIRAEDARRQLNNEKRRIELIDDERDKAFEKEELRFKQELKAAKENKEDIELVELIHQKKLEEIRKRFRLKKVANLEREIKVERELITEWDDSYLKELEKREQEANAIREQNRNEAIRIAQDLTNELGSELQKRNEMQLESLDIQIENVESSIERQQELAAQGLDNQLAFEEERLNEINLQRKEALEKQQRQEEAIKLAEAFISSFEARLQDNPDTALQKATQDVFLARGVAKAIAAGFAYDGTEDTGGGLGLDEKNGKLWMVHPNERIMSKAQNNLVGDLSNDELANLAYNYRMGIPVDAEKSIVVNNNGVVVEAVKSLENTIKNRPIQQIDIDKLGNIIETLDSGKMKTRTRLKTRGRL